MASLNFSFLYKRIPSYNLIIGLFLKKVLASIITFLIFRNYLFFHKYPLNRDVIEYVLDLF